MSPSGRETGVVFLSGVRTGFGGFGGALKDLTATDLGVLAGAEALARSGVAPAEVDHVVFGNVLQTSADAPYLARHVGLRAGLPHRDAGGDGEPALRVGVRGRRAGRAADHAGRVPGGARRRHRVA